MKIIFLGNSVSVRVRPLIKEAKNYSFVNLIESSLPKNDHILKFAQSGLMINEFAEYPDKLIIEQPDFLICNFGIVELSSRSVNRFFYNFLYYKKARTRLGKKFQLSLQIIETKLRVPLVYSRFRRPWYNLSCFLNDYFEFIERVLKDTNSEIILIGINTPNKRVEKQLPGSIQRVKRANKMLRERCNSSEKIHFISTEENLKSYDHFPDGVHFNNAGHKIIADQIISIISKG